MSKKCKLVRTVNAGVFVGFIESREGQHVVMTKARRLWYWDGAASLSQLSVDGPQKPQNCKFPQEVERVELYEVIEILDVSDKAKAAIDAVEVWKC